MLLGTHLLFILATYFSLIILFFFFVYTIQFISLLFAVQSSWLLCIIVLNIDLLKNKQKGDLLVAMLTTHYIYGSPFLKQITIFFIKQISFNQMLLQISCQNLIKPLSSTLTLRMPRLTMNLVYFIKSTKFSQNQICKLPTIVTLQN